MPVAPCIQHHGPPRTQGPRPGPPTGHNDSSAAAICSPAPWGGVMGDGMLSNQHGRACPIKRGWGATEGQPTSHPRPGCWAGATLPAPAPQSRTSCRMRASTASHSERKPLPSHQVCPHAGPTMRRATSTEPQVSGPRGPTGRGRLSASAANSCPGRRGSAQLLAASRRPWAGPGRGQHRARPRHARQPAGATGTAGQSSGPGSRGRVFSGGRSGWRGHARPGVCARDLVLSARPGQPQPSLGGEGFP